MARVEKWVHEWQFTVFAPLLVDGADLKQVLEQLEPTTELERNAVSCLRDVISKLPPHQ
jgi:hypothetical protein